MGKTLGNAINLQTLHEHFSNDMIRYFLLREVPFGQDSEVSYGALIDRVNADLANGLGNLASRTLTMIRNYFDGNTPRQFGDEAQPIAEAIAQAKAKFDEEYNALNFSRALEAAWVAIAAIDKFITDNQPWKLAKEEANRAKLAEVLATAYEGLRHIVLLVAPVLPQATKEIWQHMGLAGEPLKINPNDAKWGEELEIKKIETVSPAFPKLNNEKIMAEINAEEETKKDAPTQAANTEAQTATSDSPKPEAATVEAPPASDSTKAAPATVTEKINIDDFVKVELRAATVLEAERVPKADKLLRLQIDVGEEQPRQILAGIAEYYAPEDVIGRKIIVVANLAPRKMRGFESNGMLLAASVGAEGRPVLATFGEDVPNGTRLK